MGCYNRIGFHSKLPILGGNEVMYFICATNGKQDDSTPLSVNDLMEPICLPIYGTYDEYGGITDIYKDRSVKAIEKAFNCTIEDIVKALHRFSYSKAKDFTDEVFENMFKEEKKQAQLYLDILNKLTETLPKGYSAYRNKDDISLCFTMEHKFVYQTISSMFRDKETDNDEVFGGITFKKYLDETIMYVVRHKFENVNIFSFLYETDREEPSNTDFGYFKIRDEFICKSGMRDFSYEMMIYNVAHIENYEHLRFDILVFLWFNMGLMLMCGKYETSNYGSQSLDGYMNRYKMLLNTYDVLLKGIYKDREDYQEKIGEKD